jgi:hypothetical protein
VSKAQGHTHAVRLHRVFGAAAGTLVGHSRWRLEPVRTYGELMPESSEHDNVNHNAEAVERLDAERSATTHDVLNEAAAAVFTSHANKPSDEVLIELKRRAKEAGYEPKTEDLRPAADAISGGEHFQFD